MNPDMLILLLKTSIFMVVQANLHAMVLVVTTPVILLAKMSITLRQEINCYNLVFGFYTRVFLE